SAGAAGAGGGVCRRLLVAGREVRRGPADAAVHAPHPAGADDARDGARRRAGGRSRDGGRRGLSGRRARGPPSVASGYCWVDVLTPMTRKPPFSSLRSTVPGPRISLSPTLNAMSSTLTPVILPSVRSVDRPRKGSASCTSDFCAAGSSMYTPGPTFTITLSAVTVFISSHF